MINKNILSYIENNILPLYERNEKGHSIDHIDYVIDRSLRFANQFDNLNLNLVYIIAAYHDIAHNINKDKHEILSAEIFFNDKFMKNNLSEEERKIIKEAIEDHRASSNKEPRSIYGKIISSADRSVNIDEFISRIHFYNLKHFPHYSESEMINRGYDHLKQKYGKDGYAKNYIKDEEYDRFKEDVKLLIENKDLFAERYKTVICK